MSAVGPVVISFAAVCDLRAIGGVKRPTPFCAGVAVDLEVHGDPVSEPFQEYLFEYPHDGGTWVLKVKARDPEDARKRLKALAWARYKGEVAATIPMPSLFSRALACIVPHR